MTTTHLSHFSHRVTYHWPHVAPATILSNEILQEDGQEQPRSLRAEASTNGLCFIRIVRYLPHADVYQGQVAATPELLQVQPLDVFFTEEQLYTVLPLDCRVQQKDTTLLLDAQTLLARLHAHAAECRPLTRLAPEACAPLHPEPIVALTPLDDVVVEVTTEEVKVVLTPDAGTARVQQALLFLVLHKLGYISVRIKGQWKKIMTSRGFHLLALRRWQRRTKQRVVNIISEGGRGWTLLIGDPETFFVPSAASHR